MLLWFIFALMTAAVLAAVLAPLARPGSRAAAERASGSIAVYRDQLDEVEADRARGLIGESEAEAARIEISRRLLQADSIRAVPERSGLARRSRDRTAIAIALLVPVVTAGIYLAYGSPGMPGFPAVAHNQKAPEQASIAELVARVEARLRVHPDDGEGWEVIAPVYMRLGRYRDAANAYERAARLNGESVKLLAGFADASVLASDGIVTEKARRAYEKVLEREPARIEARFWLALAKEQDGKLAEALADYRALLSSAPADAPWRSTLAERIDEVSGRLGTASGTSVPGPTPADVAAAQALSPEERGRMIGAMVEGLAKRLKQNGSDLAGWQRLVNAYVVLDRKTEARAALEEARRNFAGDERALGELGALATSLGLGS